MKKMFLVIVAAVFTQFAKAQIATVETALEGDTLIYVAHNLPAGKDSTLFSPPEFPGGRKKLNRFLGHAERYTATDRIMHNQGYVMLQMIVEKDGSFTEMKIISHVSDGLDKEALRDAGMMPKWQPARYNGKPVRAITTIPVGFFLQDR